MVRGYSRLQVQGMENFNRSDYSFPKTPGRGTGILTMKEWGNSRCLICYFDMDDGEKLMLSVWQERDSSRSYKPKNCDLDLTTVEIGSRMEIGYELTKSGKSRFLYANALIAG